MDRRSFISVIGGSILASPFAAGAQQTGKVYRIGIVSGGSPSRNSPHIEAFRQGLRDTGWVEGRDVLIEWRSAEGRTDKLTELVAELVHLKIDVIVTAGSTPATLAAKRATTTTPIVMVGRGPACDRPGREPRPAWRQCHRIYDARRRSGLQAT